MEDKLSEYGLESPSVVGAETWGLLASSRARAQVWPPDLGGRFHPSSIIPRCDGHTLACSKRVP